jgi:hypothetical protein
MTAPKSAEMKKGLRSKLTPEDVVRLRAAEIRGVLNTREAARLLRVSPETIRRAVRGDTFSQLAEAIPKNEEELEQAAAESMKRFAAALAQERAVQELPAKIVNELEEAADGKPDAGYA